MPTPTLAGPRRSTPAQAEEPVPQRTRWSRFLDTVLPAPSPERLVPVTDVPRAMVPFVEESLADAEIGAVIQEFPSGNGDTRFQVLVAARDRAVAEEVLTGL